MLKRKSKRNTLRKKRKSIFKNKGAIADKGAFYILVILMLLLFGSYVMVGGALPTIRPKDNTNFVVLNTVIPLPSKSTLQLYTFSGTTVTPSPAPALSGSPSPDISIAPDIPIPPCSHYVAKNGSDSNPGTESSPWLTITKAASTAVSGNTVCVKDGVYNERVAPQNNGVTFVSPKPRGAVIDGAGIGNPGDWIGLVDIKNKNNITFYGFEIKNAVSFGVMVQGGDRASIINKGLDNFRAVFL